MRRLLGGRARLRWVHQILGGALLMPYFMVGSVAVSLVSDGSSAFASFPLFLAAYAMALPLAAVTGLFALVRPMSVTAVRALCGVPGEQLADGPARSRAARGRTSAWWTLHLGLGALVSGMTLAATPMAVVLFAVPFVSRLRRAEFGLGWVGSQASPYLAPFLGLALMAVVVLCAAGAGALLARMAPVLLGPTPADRLAAAEERAADLAVRNRLARELHDAVGHALSAVTLQAVAARRVLDTDPEFVREALAAIEDTTRRTVGELDAVLGLLRDGDAVGTGMAPAPTLHTDLAGLLDRTRAAGTPVADRQRPGPSGSWEQLPAIVSREAYRIVQEGLSNAMKHGKGPVELSMAVRSAPGEQDRRELEITMTNRPERSGGRAERTGGGRGLHGTAERAALLGGTVEAGEREGRWRLRAVLPLTGADRERAAGATVGATGDAGADVTVDAAGGHR
ncbi:sensor histidine kinase [Streptomyces sp. NPDC048603]|uniref:sensor histidine kinase n=1 Tax=Streptomyces sp. NPDC048603 TaxID=3365577 RepID=UPI003712E967